MHFLNSYYTYWNISIQCKFVYATAKKHALNPGYRNFQYVTIVQTNIQRPTLTLTPTHNYLGQLYVYYLSSWNNLTATYKTLSI